MSTGDSRPADATTSVGRLRLALYLNLGFACVELLGGFLTQSVAILADAFHDLGDSLALASALFLEKAARRGASPRFSYGMGRLSLLSALLLALVLLLASALVIYLAVPRLLVPTQPHTPGMMFLAVLGIAINGYAALKTREGRSINEQVISWHLLEDVLGWVLVLISAGVMMVADLPVLDPLLAIAFALYILWGVGRNARQALRLFLQGVPNQPTLAELESALLAIPQVVAVHDLHLWSLDGENHVASLHAVVNPSLQGEALAQVKAAIKSTIAGLGQFHVTVEMEAVGEACDKQLL